LLSLMLAQKTTAAIDAVEIDSTAYEQAAQNFSASPFDKQLTAHHTDVLQFEPGKKYDGILCNPPFFEGDLQSDNAMKNAAKHSTTFNLQQLLHTADRLLTAEGILALLLPFPRVNAFIQPASEMQFYLLQQLLLRHTTAHPFFRGILFLSRQPSFPRLNELVIKNELNAYTDEFMDLLGEYYL
jgi:tRNA1Val (adenine37-N6)-methyltransferase